MPLLLAACNREFAQTPSSSGAAAPPVLAHARGDAVARDDNLSSGRQLASQGAAGVTPCASCHGASGEGNGPDGYPRLAGQDQAYLEHQLDSFADGTRAHPVMTLIAGAMTPAQRTAASAFYAGLGSDAQAAAATAVAGAAPSTASAATTPATAQPQAITQPSAAISVALPPMLAARGDEARGIRACADCHEPPGVGGAAANPYLAGQNAQYLTDALAAWKSGARHNDRTGQMPVIAKALSEDEAGALAAYYADQPAPAPRHAGSN